ncbi:unnamed protein product [Staurois parvus]|uniref:Uncharacterized protein n=1 Tax=Staurois parvus TaxID=386267 RepID=A0ABN9AM03_9NEOB|nr:unnamed protein product [Staurois parvus]
MSCHSALGWGPPLVSSQVPCSRGPRHFSASRELSVRPMMPLVPFIGFFGLSKDTGAP